MKSLKSFFLFPPVGNILAAFLMNGLGVCVGFSQSQFEFTLKQLDEEDVRGYVQPIGDLLGANMNAGLYHSARLPENGFHLRIDLVGMATMVKDEHRTYSIRLPDGFVPEGGSHKTATVFGSKGTIFRDINSGLEYKGSDGIFNTNIFPLFIPQLTVGTVLGTEASVRYIATPAFGAGKFPSTTLFGIGVRHSASQYLANSPIDVAIGGYYSSFAVTDVIDYRGASLSMQMSKTFALVTLYGGAAWETSTTSLHYKTDATLGESFVHVTMDGGNRFRFTTGLEIDLQAVKIYADANFGYVQHFSGGVGFGF